MTIIEFRNQNPFSTSIFYTNVVCYRNTVHHFFVLNPRPLQVIFLLQDFSLAGGNPTQNINTFIRQIRK